MQNVQEPDKSSPSAMRQLSSKLWCPKSPRRALIMHSPPNAELDIEDIDAMEGFLAILALLGESL